VSEADGAVDTASADENTGTENGEKAGSDPSANAEQDAAKKGKRLPVLEEVDEYLNKGEPATAGRILDEAIMASESVKSALPLLHRAMQIRLEVMKDAPSMERLLVRLQRRLGSHPALEAALGDVLEKLGRYSEAVRALRRLVDGLPDPSHRAQAWLRIARMQEDHLGRLDAALESYEASLKDAPGLVDAALKGAQLALRSGLPARAKEIMDQMAGRMGEDDANRPAVCEVYLAIAEDLLHFPLFHDIAMAAANRVMALADDTDQKGMRALEIGESLEAYAGNWQNHMRALRDDALSARDKIEAARRYLAIAQIASVYDKGAARVDEDVDKCLLLAPQEPQVLRLLEATFKKLDRLDAFVEKVQAQAEKVRAPAAAVQIGMYLYRHLESNQGSDDAKIAALERVVGADSTHEEAVLALSEFYRQAGNAAGAAELFENLVAKSRDAQSKRDALKRLAIVYETELSALDKAAATLEKLRDLGGDDAETLTRLAELYDQPENAAARASVLETLVQLIEATDPDRTITVITSLFELFRGPLAEPSKAFEWGQRLYVLAPNADVEGELERLAGALARPRDLAQTYARSADRATDLATARLGSLRAARWFIEARETGTARGILEDLLGRDPNDKEALALFDTLLTKGMDPEEELAILTARLDHLTEKSDRIKTRLQLAGTYERLRRPEDGLRELDSILYDEPEHREALRKKAEILSGQERHRDLAQVLEQELRLAERAGEDGDAIQSLIRRLARIYDSRLGQPEKAAGLYLRAFEADAEDLDTVRALERLQAQDIHVVAIAEALQPYYFKVKAWRQHVDMIQIRRQSEDDPERRAALSVATAGVLEEQLKAPREAFDSWAQALVDRPGEQEYLDQLNRLAESTKSHARYAEVLQRAAENLPEGPQKLELMSRRAQLLQGELGDEDNAINAHKAVLEKNPTDAGTLRALSDIYERREAWDDYRSIQEKRLELGGDDVGAVAAALGEILLHQLENAAAANPILKQAAENLEGAKKVGALRNLVDARRQLFKGNEGPEMAEPLTEAMALLASNLAGEERAALRVEFGHLTRIHLGQHAEALNAYEAALANHPDHEGAFEGIRAILDDSSADASARLTSARILGPRYASQDNKVGEYAVLKVRYDLESDSSDRHKLAASISELLADDLEAPEDALDFLLEHLESESEDLISVRAAESLAAACGREAGVLAAWQKKAQSEDPEVARTFAGRVAAMAEAAGSVEQAILAHERLAELDPTSEEPLLRLRGLYAAMGQVEDVFGAQERLVALADGSERRDRWLALATSAFEELGDPDRGFNALFACLGEFPEDDDVLAALENRLEESQRLEELDTVLQKRVELASEPPARAARLLRRGRALAYLLDNPTEAVTVLTEALSIERDGHSTPEVTDLLQSLAGRDDEAARNALFAIVDHHRTQEAWQPLVESLEIAVTKTEGSDERARLLDEISQLQEEALRVPQLAFHAACRATREEPTTHRADRVAHLAQATGGYADVFAVFADAGNKLAEADPEAALGYLRRAAGVAQERIEDDDAKVRINEAILALAPGDEEALARVVELQRHKQDRGGLVEALRKKAQTSDDATERKAALMEAGEILFTELEDPQGAEECFRQVLFENERTTTPTANLPGVWSSSD
jgi:hypothetical protein